MSSPYKRAALMGWVAVLVPAFSGCADYSAPEPVGPGSAIHNGARIQGKLVSRVDVVSATGTQTILLPETYFKTKLSNGIAAQPFMPNPRSIQEGLSSLAAVVAVEVRGNRSAPSQRSLSFTDETGHRHEIQVSEQGGRLTGTRHVIDGVLFAETSKQWFLRGSAWSLDGTDIVVHANRREIRLNSQASAQMAAQLDGTGRLKSIVGSSARSALSVFAPTDAYAYSCLSAALNLAAAAAAVAGTATAVVVDAPLLAAAILWYAAATVDYGEQCGPIGDA